MPEQPKQYCAGCHIQVGTHDPHVVRIHEAVMHSSCYEQMMRNVINRTEVPVRVRSETF